MKSIFQIFLLLLPALLEFSCAKQDAEKQRLSWFTEDPMSIPYRVRLQRFEKPNLLRNGSFETGRTFTIDSNKTSYVIDGWQQTGPEVEWVDTGNDSSLYARDEAYSGSRAVKISRKKAYETDTRGEGIVSEYVRVIPGNYNFNFYVRLENIQPNRARLGTRLFDAIEVQILYYDKNKIPVSSSQYFPHLDQYIDISNKSLSFANFFEIRNFGWGRITGKSYPFPFPDGDIPSNAHYIKIYIGLKGTGIMWIDSVSFSYSSSNFSAPERLAYYTDTAYTMEQAIIPEPKQIRMTEPILYYPDTSGSSSLPVIVVPADAGPLAKLSSNLLRERLYEVISKTDSSGISLSDIAVTSNPSGFQLNESRLVLSIGNTALYNRYDDIMPVGEIEGHVQGYFIFSSNDFPNIVFLKGNSDLADYYATLTALQLLDSHRPVFHNARITDYPDFENRSFLFSDTSSVQAAENAIQLVNYKMNGCYVSINSNDPANKALNELASLRSKSGPGLLGIYGMISTYPPYPGKEYDFKGDIFGWVSSMTRQIMTSAFDGIIAAPAFTPPSDSSLCYRQPLPFRNDENSSDILKSILATADSSESVFYCPVYFNNELIDLKQTVDYPDILTSGIPVLWSGASFFGTRTDDADLKRFMEYTGGRSPVYIDNSMLTSSQWAGYNGNLTYYPGKLKLFNIFEPFGNTDVEYLYKNLDESNIFINFPAGGEINIIRLATAADFFWNMKDYDPAYSLWKVLVSRYGAEASRDLIEFSGKYAEILEIYARLVKNEQVTRNLKNGETKIAEMEALLTEVSSLTGSEPGIVAELRNFTDEMKNKIRSYSPEMPAEQ